MTESASTSPHLTVYAVDDEPLIRRQYELLFQIVGIPCKTFLSGQDFLSYYRDHAPELAGCLLLDYQMPGFDGLTLFQRLQEKGCLLPALMVTAAGTIPIAVEATRSGIFAFLEKPCDNMKLVERVREGFDAYLKIRQTEDQRRALQGRIDSLTPKERETFELLLQDLPTKIIADRMGISERTAEKHRQAVFDKLEVKTLLELAELARRCGFVVKAMEARP